MSGNLLLQAEFLALPNDAFGDVSFDLSDYFHKIATDAGYEFENLRVWLSQYRIGILLEGIHNYDIESVKEIRGPKFSVAYDYNNQPTPALTGFLAGQKLEADDLIIKEVNGEKFLFAIKTVIDPYPEKKFIPLKNALMSSIPFTIESWSSESRLPQPLINFNFMYDSRLLEDEFEGVKSTNYIIDRRSGGFKHIILKDVSEYEQLMNEFGVFSDSEKRRQNIEEKIKRILPANCKMCAVTGNYIGRTDFSESVYPFCLSFDSEFLSINSAVLSDTIEIISGYATCENEKGELISNVIAFSHESFPGETEIRSRTGMLNEYLTRLKKTWNDDLKRFGKICSTKFPSESELSNPLIMKNDEEDELDAFGNAVVYSAEYCGNPEIKTIRCLMFLLSITKKLSLINELPSISLAAVIAFLNSEESNNIPSYLEKSNLLQTITEVRDFTLGKTKTINSVTTQVFLMAYLVRLMKLLPFASFVYMRRLCEVVLAGNLKFDLFEFLVKTGTDKLFTKRQWLEEIGKILLGDEYKDYASEEFLSLEHIDIVSLKEYVPEWKKTTGKSLNELSKLATEIKNKITGYETITGYKDESKLGIELSEKMVKLENNKEIDYIALYSFFITEKINIESYLGEVTSCLGKSETELLSKISVLQRIYNGLSKLPFVKRKK